MSIQAVNWAIEQTAGGTRAKAVLWSICNYANHDWLAWPSQRTISNESEQSPDSVQRQLPELEKRGIIRRIPLMYAGRKNVDFIILSPSPYFGAALADIEPLLPKGYVIDRRYAAAGCGNVGGESTKGPISRAETAGYKPAPNDIVDAAAGCGNVAPTLPQLAAHAAADAAATGGSRCRTAAVTGTFLLTSEPKDREARARVLISDEALAVADECLLAIGIEPRHPPPDWCGLAHQIQILLTRGCDRMSILAAFARLSGRRPLKPMSYFVKAAETEARRPKQPIERGSDNGQAADHRTATPWQQSRDRWRTAAAKLSASVAADEAREEGSGEIVQPAAAARRD